MPIYVYFNQQTFSSVLNSFLLLQNFFGLKMQKSFFFRKKGFESSFYKIDD